MSTDFCRQLRLALSDWWRDHARAKGIPATAFLLRAELWGFLRDSTPERRCSRYGDVDYDWEHHVNTTSGTVGWRDRLLGIFHSPYMPTDPSEFRDMMAALSAVLATDFVEFTFIDIGSGKGRTLLMASEYPFSKIVGVELISELHRAAEENIAAYRAQSPNARGSEIKSVCMDAREFVFPRTPMVVYLFNPLPEGGFRKVIRNLEESVKESPRPVWIVYHNPALESELKQQLWLERVSGTEQHSIYKTK